MSADVYSVRLKLCKMFHIFYVVCPIILNDLLLIRNGISKNNRFKRLIFNEISISILICMVFACKKKRYLKLHIQDSIKISLG